MRTFQNNSKRLFDIFFSFIILLVSSPFLIIIAIIILIFDGRPLLFKSVRYQGPNIPITIYKFRTMYRDALSNKYRLNERFMRDGYLDIPLTCEVYTSVGRILEKFQIVEFLQFYNVLFHGMSIIGNRPLPKANLELLSKLDCWEKRFDSPGGLSGITQIVGKLNLTPTERLNLEISYSEIYKNGNVFFLDIILIWKTIKLLILGKQMALDEALKLLEKFRVEK